MVLIRRGPLGDGSAGAAVLNDGHKRIRSPGYPGVSLREAVERVRILYEKVGNVGVPSDLAAVHIGFRKAHGQATSAVAALKKFGLVNNFGDQLFATERALQIINLKSDDPRYIRALKEAALSPPLYRELVERYKDVGLPAEPDLQRDLIDKRFNPRAVTVAARDFQDSLVFAGIAVNGELNLDIYAFAPPPDQLASSERRLDHGFIEEAITKAAQLPLVRRYPIDISVGRNLKAELTIVGDLCQDDLERLKKQLDRLMVNLSDGFQD